MKFEEIDLADLTPEDKIWLTPIKTVPKVDFRSMLTKLQDREYKLWRLNSPAEGLVVTLPHNGHLFIYYLRGCRLFDTLNPEDLLTVARQEGLSGLLAEVQSPGMLKLLLKRGFHQYGQSDNRYFVELCDGR